MTSSNAQGTPIEDRDARGANAPEQTPPNGPAKGGHAADGGHAGLFAAALRIVSGLTLASRFAGLARDVITARLFGDTGLGSAFRAAYAIPNLFRRLFGEGALSAAFIPQYTTLDRTDPKAAGALASLVISALLGVTGAITVLIEVALVLRLMLAPADESLTMSIALVALMIPMMPMVCLAAILGGMLQVHGKFGVPAAGPIILNAFQIAMAAAFLALGVHADMDESAKAFTIMGRVVTPTHAAYGVAVAALLASVAQVAWSWSALRGMVLWKRSFQDARSHGVIVLRKFVPVMLGLGTLQLNTMLDTVIAMWPKWGRADDVRLARAAG
jgi:putative peptidoglycan lipid II flippase